MAKENTRDKVETSPQTLTKADAYRYGSATLATISLFSSLPEIGKWTHSALRWLANKFDGIAEVIGALFNIQPLTAILIAHHLIIAPFLITIFYDRKSPIRTHNEALISLASSVLISSSIIYFNVSSFNKHKMIGSIGFSNFDIINITMLSLIMPIVMYILIYFVRGQNINNNANYYISIFAFISFILFIYLGKLTPAFDEFSYIVSGELAISRFDYFIYIIGFFIAWLIMFNPARARLVAAMLFVLVACSYGIDAVIYIFEQIIK